MMNCFLIWVCFIDSLGDSCISLWLDLFSHFLSTWLSFTCSSSSSKIYKGFSLFRSIFPSMSKIHLKGFVELDWTACLNSCCCMHNWSLCISWWFTFNLKKHSIQFLAIPLKSNRAMASIVCILSWLRSFFLEFSISYFQPTQLFCDYQAALPLLQMP